MILISGVLAAQALQAVDYGVYFWPAPGAAAVDRQFAIVYNSGQTSGIHPYKLVLRAFAPDGTLACETTTAVAPWQGRATMKKVAWFEVVYASKPAGAKVRVGKYLLRAYLTEQIAGGQRPEDTNLANNQYPWEPPQYMPVEFEVRPGAEEIRCAVPSSVPNAEMFPQGFNPPVKAR
ncbi:MAG TPA: hypothetical protein VII12_18325 [Thermoanaerobaculia bacterium]|jgi:hypothetical protein